MIASVFSRTITNLKNLIKPKFAASIERFAYKEVFRITREDKKRYIAISQTPDSLFRFEEFEFIEPWEEDSEILDEGYWNCIFLSGLYEDLKETENDARKMIGWLKNEDE